MHVFPIIFCFCFLGQVLKEECERSKKKLASVVFGHCLAIEKGPKATSISWAGSLAPSSHLIAFNIIPGTAQREGELTYGNSHKEANRWIKLRSHPPQMMFILIRKAVLGPWWQRGKSTQRCPMRCSR